MTPAAEHTTDRTCTKTCSFGSVFVFAASACLVTAAAACSASDAGFSTGSGGFGSSGSSGSNGGAFFGDASLGDAAEPPPSPDAACGANRTPTAQAPGAVLIVLDRSASMDETPQGAEPRFGEESKWQLATAALKDVVAGLPTGLKVGLSMFPTGFSCDPPTPQVPIADIVTTRSLILSNLSSNTNGSTTPTTPALIGADALLSAAKGVGARTILFLSDGQPNGCGSNVSSVADAVKTAQSHGIRTFVIGIPGSPDNDFSHLAVLGQTKRAPNCVDKCQVGFANPVNCCHYVTSASDFQNTLKTVLTEIAGKIKTDCVYPIPPAAGAADKSKVNVVTNVGGKEEIVPQTAESNTSSGWQYTDGSKTSVLLKGESCKKVVDDPTSKVDILIGCSTVIN
jgi:von Willebrand factor type A domain